LPDANDGVACCGDVGPSVEYRGVELAAGGNQRRQLPVGKMGGKDQRRLAVGAQLLEAFEGLGRVEDVACAFLLGIEDPQSVDVGEFGRYAPEVVPDPAQDRLDLCG